MPSPLRKPYLVQRRRPGSIQVQWITTSAHETLEGEEGAQAEYDKRVHATTVNNLHTRFRIVFVLADSRPTTTEKA